MPGVRGELRRIRICLSASECVRSRRPAPDAADAELRCELRADHNDHDDLDDLDDLDDHEQYDDQQYNHNCSGRHLGRRLVLESNRRCLARNGRYQCVRPNLYSVMHTKHACNHVWKPLPGRWRTWHGDRWLPSAAVLKTIYAHMA